jgi:NAD dependent epimerase/dehydratase
MSASQNGPVLVTGAAGFIGGHLATRLVREGAQVRALVRYNSRNERGALDWFDQSIVSEIEVVAGDLRDIESVRRAVSGTSVVFHLGALIAIPYSYVNPRDYFETNVLGTLNVAQAALAEDVPRLVHTSTSEVYGTAQTVPITEDHPLTPQSPYAASKVGADKLMDAYFRSFDLPVTVLRPFNTYGPHQLARAVIPTIISQALAGGDVRLGALDPRRDFTFVEDSVSGFLDVARSPATIGRTLQLGTGNEVSIGELVEVIGEVMGRQLNVISDTARLRPPNSEVERLISSPALATEMTGWVPTVNLRDGLRKTVEWLDQNRHRFDRTQYVI